MTANLVFVLNLIMVAVIVFYEKKKKKKRKNLNVKYRWLPKVPGLQLLIWYLSLKTEMNKLCFIWLRQT